MQVLAVVHCSRTCHFICIDVDIAKIAAGRLLVCVRHVLFFAQVMCVLFADGMCYLFVYDLRS